MPRAVQSLFVNLEVFFEYIIFGQFIEHVHVAVCDVSDVAVRVKFHNGDEKVVTIVIYAPQSTDCSA